MANNPYFYFSDLYKNTNDDIICIDECLKPVYISESVRFTYGFNVNDDVLTNCFIPSSFTTDILDSIKYQRACSFNYICIRDDTPKKCYIFPTEINSKKFATLLVINNDSGGFERSQNAELKNNILSAHNKICDFTSTIISEMKSGKNNLREDIDSNPILSYALKIRREIENLTIISRKNIRNEETVLIDVNKYIKRTAEIITVLLGEKRINFELDLYDGILLTEYRIEVLDMLISNIVATAIKDTKGCAHIIIKSSPYKPGEAQICIADSKESCNNIDYALKSNNSSSDELCAIPILEKIIESKKCKLVSLPNSSGGLSIGFTLPPIRERADILREPSYDDAAQKGILSAIGTGLADLFN